MIGQDGRSISMGLVDQRGVEQFRRSPWTDFSTAEEAHATEERIK
jgi:hypothetical protein